MWVFKETTTPHLYILQCLRIYLNFEILKKQSFQFTIGCKDGKVDQKDALVYQNHNCFGQRPKSSSKVFSKLDFFFHNELYCCVKDSNVEYQAKFFKLIIESDAQKQMLESSFGCRFHDLKYFDVVNFHIL
jgi:hypothetical protein